MRDYQSIRPDLPSLSQAYAVGTAIGLTIAAVAAALVSVAVIGTVARTLDLQGTVLVRIIQFAQVQIGFLLVAVGYLIRRDTPRRSLRFRFPSLHDFGWLVLLCALIAVVSAPDSTWFLTPALTTDPVAWVVVFVWWFLIAAPAEELLFRGIIQGRLKSSFSVITAVVLAAGLFAGMHVGFALYRGYGGNFLGLAAVMFATGLLFGSVYERTGNLVVPSFAHALFWLSPALLAYL